MSAKEKTGRAARIDVKLAHGVDPARPDEILSGTPGLRSVIQLFPDEAEEELSSLYILEVDPSKVEQAINCLRRNPAIEYAEETAPRKLIR